MLRTESAAILQAVMHLPLEDHGGAGPVIHFAPANGFPVASYEPLLAQLRSRFRLVSVPPRALWSGRAEPPADPGRWEELGDDLLAGFAEHGLEGVIGMGHSFGAVASLLAACRRPTAFRALILLDPTLLPAAMFQRMDEGRRANRAGWHPLVARTRERRDRFASPDDAFRYFRTRSAFADWSDQAIDWYVRAGVVLGSNGDWRLAWSPAWEAYYYESIDTEAWPKVADLDPSIAVLLLHGSRSDTFTAECRDRFARLAPGATIAAVEGGHLFPQSSPEATGAAVLDWLERIVTGRTG